MLNPSLPGGDDGYRHVKLAARLVREPAAVFADPWHLVYFWPKPVDAWFGYHMLLAPLTVVPNLIIAAKIGAALVFSMLVVVLIRTAGQIGACCPVFWAVLATTGSGIVVYRAGMCRPFLFSVALTIAALLFTIRNRPLAVGVVAALHAASYSMFFMVAFGPCVNLALRRDRRALEIFAAACAGLGAGLLLNPYAPENLRFDLTQLATPFLLARNAGVAISRETAPLPPGPMMMVALPSLCVWGAALVEAWRRSRHGRRLEPHASLLLWMSVLAFAATLRAARTLDYFIPIASLFSAAMLSDWATRNRRDAKYLASLVIALCAFNVTVAVHEVMHEGDHRRFQGVSRYLAEHGRGATVVNSRWDQYPFLYFWNSESRYLTGVDPTFLYLADARTYWIWRHLSDDDASTCPEPTCKTGARTEAAEALFRDIGAGFVLTDHARNPRIEDALRKSPSAREVYRDASFSLFASAASQSGT